MAIIVDKEQKRRSIALACKSVVIENGIHNLSVASLAKIAGIGKGTIYEYFKSKEEIVFEITSILMQEHHEKLRKSLQNTPSTKEKVKCFSQFFYSEDERELREIYKMFTSLSLVNPSDEMLAFQTESFNNYYKWFQEIIQKGVEKKELNSLSYDLCMGMFTMSKGMFLTTYTTTAIEDLKYELDLFIDTIFTLMEKK